MASPLPFIILWWIGGALTVVVPAIKWSVAKKKYYNSYGRYAQANQGNYWGGQYDDGRSYAVFNCKWWQYKCREEEMNYLQTRQNQDGQQQGVPFMTPSWYSFVGGQYDTDSHDREMMGMELNHNSGALQFVFAWSIILFVGMLIFGTFIFWRKRSVAGLAVIMALMTQYALLLLVLLPQGVITTDNRELEETPYGWYGQLSILMVYFYFAQCIFSIVFAVLIMLKLFSDQFVVNEFDPEEAETAFNYQPKPGPEMLLSKLSGEAQ